MTSAEETFTIVRQRLLTEDSYAAAAFIQEPADAIVVADRYFQIVNGLYWKAKDLPAVIIIAGLGIAYCLHQPIDLRSHAKRLAYNLGSFTWNGWDEPGIAISPDQLATGRDAARLNLRLAGELAKPAEALSAAHWLVGAHGLSIGDYDFAGQSFKSAAACLPNQAAPNLNSGYIALAERMKTPNDATLEREFVRQLSELDALGTEEAHSAAAQLRTAASVFLAGK